MEFIEFKEVYEVFLGFTGSTSESKLWGCSQSKQDPTRLSLCWWTMAK